MQFVVRPKTRLMHFASHSTFALRTLTHTKKLHKSRQATRFRNNAKVACRPDLSRSVLGLSWACPGPVPCSSGTKCKTWQLNSSQAEPTQPQSCSWRWSVYLRFLLFLLFFFCFIHFAVSARLFTPMRKNVNEWQCQVGQCVAPPHPTPRSG